VLVGEFFHGEKSGVAIEKKRLPPPEFNGEMKIRGRVSKKATRAKKRRIA